MHSSFGKSHAYRSRDRMSFQHTRPKDPRPVNRDKHSEAGMVLAC